MGAVGAREAGGERILGVVARTRAELGEVSPLAAENHPDPRSLAFSSRVISTSCAFKLYVFRSSIPSPPNLE